MSKVSDDFIPLQITVLTVSARRTAQDDTSGDYLREAAQEAGHQIVASAIVKENRYQIQAQVTAWIASETVQVILINGGTGFTTGDVTPEAISRCSIAQLTVLVNCFAWSPMRISAPPPFSPVLLRVWQTKRLFLPCPARHVRVAPPGNVSFRNSWMPGKNRAIFSPI